MELVAQRLGCWSLRWGWEGDSTLHPSAFLYILSPYILFPDGGNRSSEKWSNLSKVTQLVVVGAGFKFRSPLCPQALGTLEMRVESGLKAPAQIGLIHFFLWKGWGRQRSQRWEIQVVGLVGSCSPKRISEGRTYLKNCMLSLGIRKLAPTVTRWIKIRRKDLSDKGAPAQSGGACTLVSTECQRGTFSLITLEPGACKECLRRTEVWEMGYVGDMGCISFSNRQEGMYGHRLRAESKDRNGVGRRTRRDSCPPGLGEASGGPIVVGERAHWVCTHPHMHACALSAEEPRRDLLTTSFWRPVSALSQCCALDSEKVLGLLWGPGKLWRCYLCGQKELQRARLQFPHTLTWLKYFPWAGLATPAVLYLRGGSSALSHLCLCSFSASSCVLPVLNPRNMLT